MLDEAFEILREIQARGRLAVIVGGAVRDLLLGRPLTDVDLATDMPLAELSSLFKTHAVGRSEKFDTVVIIRGGRAFEISRFRGGGQERSRPAAARSRTASTRCARTPRTGTSPSTRCSWGWTAASSIFRAASTICATAWSAASARRRSASPKTRRGSCAPCVSPPASASRSRRRPPRRSPRDAPRLATVAGERIGKEILKIAAQPGAALADAVTLMDRFGLLGLLLPEVGDLRGLPQPIEWHPEGDAWEHTLAALRSSTSADPAVNLAVLLHDVGKRPAHREVGGPPPLSRPRKRRGRDRGRRRPAPPPAAAAARGDRLCRRAPPAGRTVHRTAALEDARAPRQPDTGRSCGLSRCATSRRGGTEPRSRASTPPFARPRRTRRRSAKRRPARR